MKRLFELKSQHDHLLALAIDVDTGEIVDDVAFGAFEGVEGAIAEKAIACAIVIKELDARAVAIKEIADGLAIRVRALTASSDHLRDLLRNCLPAGSKYIDPRAEVRIGKAPSQRCVIEDEGLLPELYCEQKWIPKTDSIRKELLAGISIPGAKLVDGKLSVSIK